jgi:aryl-alcohol dehydrogenase-like predicted oxidoreductase
MYRSSYDPEAADVHYNENVVGKFANEVGRGKLCIATKLFPRLHGDSD